MPGVAGLETVMSNHGAKNIGDPKSAFGITDREPDLGGNARHRAARRAELSAERDA